jgi:hypothetical protein
MASANRPCSACFMPLHTTAPNTQLKLSTAPFFVEKVRDSMGLYLNPPDHARVFYQR